MTLIKTIIHGCKNYSPRGICRPEIGIIHYTAAGSARSTVQWFVDPRSRTSAHYVIDRDGKIYEVVPIEYAAWHAGKSEYMGRNNVNLWSIGYELANHGLLTMDRDGSLKTSSGEKYIGEPAVYARSEFKSGRFSEGWWEPYPDRQISALKELLDHHGTPIAGHEDVAIPAGRKIDPGPLFPWSMLAPFEVQDPACKYTYRSVVA